jgi:hypothetical protein
MRYINLKKYIESEKTVDDFIDFLYYVKLVGYEAVTDEAWEISSFNLMRHDTPDCVINEVEMWSKAFTFDKGYFEIMTYKPNDGRDYMACWYMLRANNTVYGSADFVEFPIGHKEWFKNNFLHFIKEYYEQKPDGKPQDATTLERNSSLS